MRATALLVAVLAVCSSCTCDPGQVGPDGSSGGGTGGSGGSGGTGGTGGTGGAGGGSGPPCSSSSTCDGGICVMGACCASARQVCPSGCCPNGSVCLFDRCVGVGRDCNTASDCPPKQYCETGLGSSPDAGTATSDAGMCTQPLPVQGKCLALPPVCPADAGLGADAGCIEACEYRGTVGPLTATQRWQWGPVAQQSPNFTDVWATPAIGRIVDSNCDTKVDLLDPPNVVFVSGRAIDMTTNIGTCCQCTGATNSACLTGVLRVLDGRTGKEVWSLAKPSAASIGFAGLSVAIGDIFPGGGLEIAAVTGEGFIVVIDRGGQVLATSDQPVPGRGNATFGWGGGLALADMDADGFPELAYGATVFSTTGGMVRLKFTGTGGVGGGQVYEALSTFVDLDGAANGHLELLAGRTAYRSDGMTLWNRTDLGDGFSGVGDFDKDGTPEVVLVVSGTVLVLNGATGATVLPARTLGGTGFGGPPTVADFDGDGRPEVGVAQATFYTVLKPDFTTMQLAELWKKPNHDLSSSVTGSSVFDFEGDGNAEVVYADECFLWVFDGRTGDVRFSASHTSFTATEASLVADVDGDGRAEMLMVSNGADPSNAGWRCLDAAGNPTTVNGVTWTPGPTSWKGYRGLALYGDRANAWVGTRTLWNEHTYHVSNVCDDRDTACLGTNAYGAIPRTEQKNWSLPWLNNFRQNVQDKGLFDAPDPTVSLRLECLQPLVANVTLRNLGLASLPVGVEIAVFRKQAGGDVDLGHVTSTRPLLPGQLEELSLPLPGAGPNDTFFARVLIDPLNPTFRQCRPGNDETPPVTPVCIQ